MTIWERFKSAIKNTYKHALDYKGRTARLEYWLFVAFYAGVAALIYIVTNLLDTDWFGEGIYGVFVFVHFFILLSLQVRRLHDTGKSGWWVLIGVIPLIGTVILFILYILPSDEGPNRFGNDPRRFEHAPGQEVI